MNMIVIAFLISLGTSLFLSGELPRLPRLPWLHVPEHNLDFTNPVTKRVQLIVTPIPVQIGSWLVTVGLPWFRGEPDAPDLDYMPLWLIIYFVWTGSTTWVHHFSDMMKNEYMQVH